MSFTYLSLHMNKLCHQYAVRVTLPCSNGTWQWNRYRGTFKIIIIIVIIKLSCMVCLNKKNLAQKHVKE